MADNRPQEVRARQEAAEQERAEDKAAREAGREEAAAEREEDKAAREAEREERKAAQEKEEKLKAAGNCPHCQAQLVPHEGDNEGFKHCNLCGCCFTAEGEQRENHPLCNPLMRVAAAQ